LINPICSDKCEACEAPRPLELDADSPGVVVAAAALTPLRQLRRKRERSPAVADAECPVGVVAAPPVDTAPAVAEEGGSCSGGCGSPRGGRIRQPPRRGRRLRVAPSAVREEEGTRCVTGCRRALR